MWRTQPIDNCSRWHQRGLPKAESVDWHSKQQEMKEHVASESNAALVLSLSLSQGLIPQPTKTRRHYSPSFECLRRRPCGNQSRALFGSHRYLPLLGRIYRHDGDSCPFDSVSCVPCFCTPKSVHCSLVPKGPHRNEHYAAKNCSKHTTSEHRGSTSAVFAYQQRKERNKDVTSTI